MCVDDVFWVFRVVGERGGPWFGSVRGGSRRLALRRIINLIIGYRRSILVVFEWQIDHLDSSDAHPPTSIVFRGPNKGTGRAGGLARAGASICAAQVSKSIDRSIKKREACLRL